MITSELLDRLPPHNREIEQQLLGSIMLGPRILDTVGSLIGAEDFYVSAHQTVYRHLGEMSQENRHIDTPLLLDRMRTTGDLERVGGIRRVNPQFTYGACDRHPICS